MRDKFDYRNYVIFCFFFFVPLDIMSTYCKRVKIQCIIYISICIVHLYLSLRWSLPEIDLSFTCDFLIFHLVFIEKDPKWVETFEQFYNTSLIYSQKNIILFTLWASCLGSNRLSFCLYFDSIIWIKNFFF